MALESVTERVYSAASDVWSFGVLCWEVLSHGERPYASISNEGVVTAVKRGHRLPSPAGCPDDMYASHYCLIVKVVIIGFCV